VEVAGGARSNTSLPIAGQRLEYNRYTLDGVENTDPNHQVRNQSAAAFEFLRSAGETACPTNACNLIIQLVGQAVSRAFCEYRSFFRAF
jgi:hypothetical protein